MLVTGGAAVGGVVQGATAATGGAGFVTAGRGGTLLTGRIEMLFLS